MTTRYYILEGDTTTAGGIVQKTTNTLSFKVYGKNQSYIGDDVWCPACQSMGKIIPDQDRLSTKVNGRMPALHDDLCLCKCSPPPKLVHSQTSFKEVVDCKVIDNDPSNNSSSSKSILSLYWSYGPECILLDKKSRFYTDVNLHIITKGYAKGDVVTVLISSDDTTSFEDFFVDISIDENNHGVVYNIFENSKILIMAE